MFYLDSFVTDSPKLPCEGVNSFQWPREITSTEPSAVEAYEELEVRSLTGAGAEGAISH